MSPRSGRHSQDKPVIIQVIGYIPPHLGGSERVAQSLSEIMASRGYRVQLLTSAVGGRPGSTNPMSNLLIRRFAAMEFAHTPIMPGLIPAVFSVPRHSILHLHLGQAFYPELVWLAAKIRRLPYIVHFHLDLQPSGPLGGLFLIYKATVLRLVIKQADRVIVFSKDQQTLVHNQYGIPRNRIAIIPNGVGPEYFQAPRMYNKPARKLLNVGRQSSQKRLQLLIQAMPLLPRPAQLTLVGAGEFSDSLRRQARVLAANNITFTGALPPLQTLKYYRKADIFVVSSENEGMPLAVLEAMAAGLPVVASNVTGLRELINGVGVLVDEPSGPAFARALIKLMADPVRLSRLSRRSRTAAETYSWDSLADSLEKVYARVRV